LITGSMMMARPLNTTEPVIAYAIVKAITMWVMT